MREIKFRVWDKWKKKWVYPVQDVTNNFHYGNNNNLIYLQHSGFEDQNGNEIYEGSGGNHPAFGNYYVKFGEYVCPVSGLINIGFYMHFSNRMGMAGARVDMGFWVYKNKLIFDKNIHDNPEILEPDHD